MPRNRILTLQPFLLAWILYIFFYNNINHLGYKECICQFVKWQMHSFNAEDDNISDDHTSVMSVVSVSIVSSVIAMVTISMVTISMVAVVVGTVTIIYQVDTTQIMVLVITTICVVVIRVVGGAVSAGEIVRVTVGANNEAVSVFVVETVGFTSA